jgi:hydrogenase nickel incorporation protein HypA/HybF
MFAQKNVFIMRTSTREQLQIIAKRFSRMHECSVTESILKTILEKAIETNAVSISKVNLVIGEETGFMGDSIQFYFDKLSKGTFAEGAVLEMEFIKSKLKCMKCGALFERKRFFFTCPHCGEEGMPTKIGKEFYIKNIEIEEDSD